ncbi:preprotein translocase subunit SecG [Arsenicitalea aurantiaca]|uniref:Protein-export membrane protein SecG n=1 Tax=Arsenicitalea aurantiaca TaxID=1783274 RepID=A0A433XF87_9HYPH|nr:preprotein translocase subunit SecG [Arsenicitalea aurantiaca]RUT32753.1 preprotein translocase subunit SecG [Arsenicitalea aurantiaca]
MANVLIVAYLLIVLALIAVILLQRSEGGGLGMGGNAGGMMTARGSANLMTRTTAVLATLFFATAIGLTILAELDRSTQSILDRAADGVGAGAVAPTTVLDALNQLQGDTPATPAAPAAPAAPASDPGLAVPTTPSAPVDAAPAAPVDAAPATAPAAPAAPANSIAPAAPAN